MKVIRNNNIVNFADVTDITDKLTKGTYRLCFNEMTKQLYLKQIDDLKYPTRIYGNEEVYADRVLKKYYSKTTNIGCLFCGKRGTGKSYLSQMIAIKSTLPVILVDEAFEGTDFVDFMTNPALGDCCIIFDEFDKTFNCEEVNTTPMLAILDGVVKTHHLFIFTANSFYNINDSVKNRPSRVHFLREFGDISEEMVRTIGNDLLDNKDYIEDLIKVYYKLNDATFDIFVSLIEDCNLYKESPVECAKYLNICDSVTKYTYICFIKSLNKEIDGINTVSWDGSKSDTCIKVPYEDEACSEGYYWEWRNVNEFKMLSKSRDQIVLKSKDENLTVTLNRINHNMINFVF